MDEGDPPERRAEAVAARAADALRSLDPVHEVEERVEEIGDPEASPANPTGTLAVRAGTRSRWIRTGPGTGTSRELWRLAWPVMLSQVLASTVGLVDIAMVGRLGATDQAAVGYAAQLFFLAQSVLFALSFACVAVMARAIGAGHPAEARRALAASVGVSVGASTVLVGALLIAPEALLRVLAAEPAVIERCIPYLRLLMGSTVLLSLCLALESGLRANKDMATPMRITAAVTALKIGLNVLLIFGVAGFPRLELVGAGLATLIAQALAVVLFVRASRRGPRESPTRLGRRDFRNLGPLYREQVRIAIPAVAERLIMNVAMLSYFAFLGGYGTAVAAAYTIGIRILSFSWIPGIGYSQAVATLVGQSLGAGDEDGAERAGWRAARLALITAAVMGAIGVVTREDLARIFTVDLDTIAALGPFMLCLAAVQPAMQLHFTLAGAFRGAGDTYNPLIASIIGNWMFRIPLALAISQWLEWPVIWLWGALVFDHVSRAAYLLKAYRSGRWKERASRLGSRARESGSAERPPPPRR